MKDTEEGIEKNKPLTRPPPKGRGAPARLQAFAEILRKRITKLEENRRLAVMCDRTYTADALRHRREEAQLILNTLSLGDF